MQAFLVDLLTNLTASTIFTALVSVGALVYVKFGWRRLFGVSNPKKVVVVVSASAHTRTGVYKRPSTGIGQVRAMAELAPRFAQAYWRQRLDRVYTADAELHERVEGDLVVLGGEKTNKLTDELLNCWSKEAGFPVVPTQKSEIVWRGKTYASDGDGAQLSVDYGLIVRAPNPLATDSQHVAILISGASTVGGHAASRSYTTKRIFRRQKYVAALVECRVRDGLPVQLRVLDTMERSKNTEQWHGSSLEEAK